MRTVNKDVACTPFPAHAVEAQKLPSGLVLCAPRTNLAALTVMADYEPLKLHKGDVAYVPLEFANSVWGKRKLTVPQVGEFILVPADQIHLVVEGS